MASRARKTILSNPLDDINPQSVSKVLPDTDGVKTSAANISEKSVAKKTSKKSTGVPKKTSTKPSVKRVIKKAVLKKDKQIESVEQSDNKLDPQASSDAQESDLSAEAAQILSNFDELAEVVISEAAANHAKAKQRNKNKASSSDEPASQPRAEDVFDAELSKEPPRALVRVRIISDRETRAMKVVKTWSQWSVAAGIVPVPLMDVALISGIQVKMIYDLCQIYNVPFEKKSALAVASGLVGGSLSTGVAKIAGEMALKSIPYVEQVLQPTLSFATTYSMGYVFVKHFENAGTLVNFDASTMNMYFQEQFEKSKKLFSKKQAAPA